MTVDITGFEYVFSREISCFFVILSVGSPVFTVLKDIKKKGCNFLKLLLLLHLTVFLAEKIFVFLCRVSQRP